MLSHFDTSFLIAVLFVVLIFTIFIIHMHRKRKRIIAKLRSMPYSEKCLLMNSLVDSFGYQYVCPTDIFSSTLDAWQKEFGYTALYDTGAPNFNMIFDCEPVYFDYRGKTWLIEFWKGQYGINVGGEIGIYHSDRLLRKEELQTEVFQVVNPQDMLEMSLALRFLNHYTMISKRHWWLTAFCMGNFSNPRDIVMEIQMRFPNVEMLTAFRSAMLNLGYRREELYVNGTEIFFNFIKSHTQKIGPFSRFHRYIVQLQNRFFCLVFLFLTRPQKSSVDQLLFLYYHLPSAFRRTLRLRRYGRRRKHH